MWVWVCLWTGSPALRDVAASAAATSGRNTSMSKIEGTPCSAISIRSSPAPVSMLGFGNGTVYAYRMDEDDLVYLQRHAAGEMPLRGN